MTSIMREKLKNYVNYFFFFTFYVNMTYRLTFRIRKHICLNVKKKKFFKGFSLQKQYYSPCRLLTNRTQKALVSMARAEQTYTSL